MSDLTTQLVATNFQKNGFNEQRQCMRQCLIRFHILQIEEGISFIVVYFSISNEILATFWTKRSIFPDNHFKIGIEGSKTKKEGWRVCHMRNTFDWSWMFFTILESMLHLRLGALFDYIECHIVVGSNRSNTTIS